MPKRTINDIEKIWSNVEGIKKVSDRVIGIGPIGFGMDALLTWVPIVGTAYTAGTGAWLLYQAIQAKAAPSTLFNMAAYMAIDTATGTVPLVGDVVDTFFPGQLMAAKTLQRDMESTHWIEDSEASARASGAHDLHLETVRNDPKLRRVVYLHD